MFTGIIEDLGVIKDNLIESDGLSRRIRVATHEAPSLTLGESVSVNGTCLTVVAYDTGTFSAQISPTTLDITTLGNLGAGDAVNLERSVTPATRLSGHWVLGHVDTRGTVEDITPEGAVHHIRIRYPERYRQWVLPQGSITLDGISLTIVERADQSLRVTVIPHTWEHTNIHTWQVGTAINLEFDVLGKYVAHLLTTGHGTDLSFTLQGGPS